MQEALEAFPPSAFAKSAVFTRLLQTRLGPRPVVLDTACKPATGWLTVLHCQSYSSAGKSGQLVPAQQ